jgi:hypothetical protein
LQEHRAQAKQVSISVWCNRRHTGKVLHAAGCAAGDPFNTVQDRQSLAVCVVAGGSRGLLVVGWFVRVVVLV